MISSAWQKIRSRSVNVLPVENGQSHNPNLLKEQGRIDETGTQGACQGRIAFRDSDDGTRLDSSHSFLGVLSSCAGWLHDHLLGHDGSMGTMQPFFQVPEQQASHLHVLQKTQQKREVILYRTGSEQVQRTVLFWAGQSAFTHRRAWR